MATIQVQDISEDAYEIIRRRARSAGQSVQAYMKKQVERMASEPDEDELFSELEHFVASHGIPLDLNAVLADLHNEHR